MSLIYDESRLLPGLPNDISLAHIVPKLGWRDFYKLSAVSPAWCHANRSRQVHIERVRLGCTETFVLLCYERFCKKIRKTMTGVSIYSLEDDAWFELPPIPRELGGLNPVVSKCQGLDGKVYLLTVQKRQKCSGIVDMYVFDVAGQRHWRKCAAMASEGYRSWCEYGVLDGKIYSLGGCGKTSSSSRGSNQVYDPLKNAWSPIKPMKSLRMQHYVAAVGDELYVLGGSGCDDFFDSNGNRIGVASSSRNLGYYLTQRAMTVQIYHPRRDEWRAVGGFEITSKLIELVFMAQGKLHSRSGLGIQIYDLDTGRSKLLHAVSPELLGPADVGGWIDPIDVIAIGEEVLAIVTWYPCIENTDQSEIRIIRSKGVGSKNKTLIWQRATTPRFFSTIEDPSFKALSSISL